MPEEIARIGDVELAYETFGDPAHPAMLLVMGLGTQMLGWRAAFCARLAERGFHVIRYDNRDVGRSTKFSAHRPPTAGQLLRRDASAAAYTLADMADDGAGLLDCLRIDRAHVVGASMGGMIAQTIAIRHPDRVLSLASIMSNTGARVSATTVGATPPARHASSLRSSPPATGRGSCARSRSRRSSSTARKTASSPPPAAAPPRAPSPAPGC